MKHLKGDLFDSSAEALAHGVNCKGVMGAGIAKQFSRRYPTMYSRYRGICSDELLRPGMVWPWRDESGLLIYNVASQDLPGPRARLRWLEQGMTKALKHAERQGITSMALPRMGCGIGGLSWAAVESLLEALEDRSSVSLEVWTL